MEHKNSLGRRLQIRKIRSRFKFPSLFSNLVTVYISILLIMLFILFIALSRSFQTYFVKYTQDIMINQAENIASRYYTAEPPSSNKNHAQVEEEKVSEMINKIQDMNSYMNSSTWLIDAKGGGLSITPHSIQEMSEEIVDKESIDRVLNGKVIAFENAFKENFKNTVLTIGYPIVVDGRVKYALFIHTPMPYVLQIVDGVRSLILEIVGIVGTVAFIWIYVIAKQMTKPLMQMNLVAKEISGGEFDRRIQVEGHDEIAQLASSLNHMAEELEKTDDNRRSFIANISHDLRSPLTSISGFVTAILDGTIQKEKQEHYLKIVLSETKRLISMTNAILDLNQVEEGVKEFKKVKFNIRSMMEHSISSLENRAKQRNVFISTDFDEHHEWVMGEVESMERVVQNLLDNSLKFVEDNGHIIVRTSFRKQKLWVSILNDGPEIPPAHLKHIWERFYKADESRGKDKKGVGLGLVIVKEIIRQHDEVIGVNSNKGEYVEFYFSMTVARE